MSVGADNLGSGDLPRTSIIYFTPAENEQEAAFFIMMNLLLSVKLL